MCLLAEKPTIKMDRVDSVAAYGIYLKSTSYKIKIKGIGCFSFFGENIFV